MYSEPNYDVSEFFANAPPYNSYALDGIFSRELPMEAGPIVEDVGPGCYSVDEFSLNRLDSGASFSDRV